jgi:hypothetical protein
MATLKYSLLYSLDNVIDKLFDKISINYNIPKVELIKLYEGEGEVSGENKIVNNTINETKKEINNNTQTDETLNKMTKPELIELCKLKNIKVSGTKTELIHRLLNNTSSDSKTQLQQKTVTSLFQQQNKQKDNKIATNPIMKKLSEKKEIIQIQKNKFGNFEHSDTSFIIDQKTKKVIGKQNSDGTISKLVASDIDLCNKYKFDYNIPENLDDREEEDCEEEELLEEEIDNENLENLDEIECDDLEEEEEEELEEEELEEFYE